MPPKKTCFSLIVIALLALAACHPIPQIKNYPPPELGIDFNIFKDVGCPLDKYGFRFCNSDSPLATLGCDEIREPSPLLGGLNPSFPISQCLVEPWRHSYEKPGMVIAEMDAKGEFFYNAGGLFPTYVRYIIYQDGQFKLIKTEEEFRKLFAPIESPNEALSYALAVKDLQVYYGLQFDFKYEYFVTTLEDSHVDTITDGYSVHLFHYEGFGCGPHTTSAVDLHISPDGTIEQVSKEPVYNDPSQDGICVD